MTKRFPDLWREPAAVEEMLDALRAGIVRDDGGVNAGNLVRIQHPLFPGDYADLDELAQQTQRCPDLEVELGDRVLQHSIIEHYAIQARLALSGIRARAQKDPRHLRIVDI